MSSGSVRSSRMSGLPVSARPCAHLTRNSAIFHNPLCSFVCTMPSTCQCNIRSKVTILHSY
jgi:hypothetical protein